MIAYKILEKYCNKCKSITLLTEHHLFDYPQVKKELSRIYEKPYTEKGHIEFHKLIRKFHRKVPKIMLCEECHQDIEKAKRPIQVKKIWT